MLITFLNIPNLPQRYRFLMDNRAQFLEIDEDLVDTLRVRVKRNEVVAFAPWGNDFIANYLAPTIGFRTFNIGGDKNLSAAQESWPSSMKALSKELDGSKTSFIFKILWDKDADVLVIPYFSMLWSPHLWPCVDQTTAKLTEISKEDWNTLPGFECPDQRKIALQPFIRELERLPYIEVTDNNLFATVRLRPQFSTEASRQTQINAAFGDIRYPIEFGSGLQNSSFILEEGWYALEEHHVWSQSLSKLVLPVPSDCSSGQCFAILHFSVFGASKQRPVAAEFESQTGDVKWHERITSTSQDNNKIAVPLGGSKPYQEVLINVQNATSPQALTGSPDDRVLGVGILNADLERIH